MRLAFRISLLAIGLASLLGAGAASAGSLVEFPNVSEREPKLLGYLARPTGDNGVYRAGCVSPNRADRRLVGFAADSPVEEAVRSELVSEPPIPCYSGKIQGNSSTTALSARIGGRNSFHNQRLTGKFPTQWNRELIGLYQGIKSAHQGEFPPEQGSPPFGLNCLTMVRVPSVS
jgi:hypothetical protein